MDVLGPTLKDVAQAFTATIPYNGKLVVMKITILVSLQRKLKSVIQNSLL